MGPRKKGNLVWMTNIIKKVGVIYGGKSAEREVSINTGKAVAAALKSENYNVVMLDSAEEKFVNNVLASRIDMAFIALHGGYGENGTIQGFFEILGIPYTGSGVTASSLAMNKKFTKNIFSAAGINTPRWLIVNAENKHFVTEIFDFPAVVKPVSQGSAIGVSIVRKEKDCAKAIDEAMLHGDEVIVEEYIEGTEITVAMLGEKPLTPIQIIPKNKFYDYYSKYAAGGSEHIIPPRLSQGIIKNAKALALRAHHALGCRVFSRVDIIVDKKNKLHVLEVNTLPGMTATSLYPDAAKFDGWEFGSLLKEIIRLSMN